MGDFKDDEGHVAFFRVICYNPALQIKMTKTTPSGHVHEEVVLQWRRSEEGEARRWFWNGDDGEERRGGGFAMEKRERSVRQRFRIGREGRRAVAGSKSKSIYPSIKKATPH